MMRGEEESILSLGGSLGLMGEHFLTEDRFCKLIGIKFVRRGLDTFGFVVLVTSSAG